MILRPGEGFDRVKDKAIEGIDLVSCILQAGMMNERHN